MVVLCSHHKCGIKCCLDSCWKTAAAALVLWVKYGWYQSQSAKCLSLFHSPSSRLDIEEQYPNKSCNLPLYRDKKKHFPILSDYINVCAPKYVALICPFMPFKQLHLQNKQQQQTETPIKGAGEGVFFSCSLYLVFIMVSVFDSCAKAPLTPPTPPQLSLSPLFGCLEFNYWLRGPVWGTKFASLH